MAELLLLLVIVIFAAIYIYRRDKRARWGSGGVAAAAQRGDDSGASESTDERLERSYQELKAGLIDLREYRRRIVEEQAAIREDRAIVKGFKRKGIYSQSEYDDEIVLLDDAEEACRWRLEWADNQSGDQPA